jgi:hypothetical protein
MAVRPLLGPLPLFSFLIFYTVGRTSPVARPLPAHSTAQTQQTSIPQVGIEPTIPVFERAETVHAVDRAATMIGSTRYALTETVSM